jgi:hypothetical protein
MVNHPYPNSPPGRPARPLPTPVPPWPASPAHQPRFPPTPSRGLAVDAQRADALVCLVRGGRLPSAATVTAVRCGELTPLSSRPLLAPPPPVSRLAVDAAIAVWHGWCSARPRQGATLDAATRARPAPPVARLPVPYAASQLTSVAHGAWRGNPAWPQSVAQRGRSRPSSRDSAPG